MPTRSPASKQPSAMPANSGRPVKLRQSCDACSIAKVKCSQESSKCSRCRANGFKCVYGESRRFGRVSNKKKTASRDSSSTDRNSAGPVPQQAQDGGPTLQHNELWPELQIPFQNVPANAVNHGDPSLVYAGNKETSMSEDKPNVGGGQLPNQQSSNPWGMPIDLDILPANFIPAAPRLSSSDYGGNGSIDAGTPPNFARLADAAKQTVDATVSDALSDQTPAAHRNKQLSNFPNFGRTDPTQTTSMQVQDRITTARHTHTQSDWPQPVRCDRCRDSAASSQRSADDIFRTNRIALQQVSLMLTCECGKDAQLAMLFASILQRVLAGYRTIIEAKADPSSHPQTTHATAHSSPLTSRSNPSEPAESPQSWNPPVRPRSGSLAVQYGSFSLDQGDVDLLRQTLALDGLRRAEQVVLQMESFHGDGARSRSQPRGTGKDPIPMSADDPHVVELYKILSAWLKTDIQKTRERVQSAGNLQS